MDNLRGIFAETRLITHPLYQAVCNDDTSMTEIQRLLDQAPHDAKCGIGLFKLIKYALLHTKTKSQVLKLFIQQDTKCAEIRDEEYGGYLLHLALGSEMEVNRLDFIRLLIKLYPNAARTRDEEGYLPLHHAAVMEEIPAVAILWLLDCYPEGAKMAVPSLGELAIHMAATRWKYMTVEVMRRIVELYPEGVQVQDHARKVPLHYACRLARVQVIEYLGSLFPKGASVRDANGCLPLHLAHEHRTQPLTVMRYLLNLYPDGIHTVDCSSGMLPLHHTCGYKETLGSRLLRESYYERDIRHCSSQERNKRYNNEYDEIIHLLIRLYPEGLQVRDNHGRLPLHHACRAPVSLRMLQTLLEQNPEDTIVADNNGLLPLHHACIVPASPRNIRFLVENNPFSVLVTAHNGVTPLQLAHEYKQDFEDGVLHQHQIQDFLLKKQKEAMRALRCCIISTCKEIGFPDLVIANILSFAKPRLWWPHV